MGLAWPVSSDITTFFGSLGLDSAVVAAVLADSDVGDEIAAAIDEFERSTNNVPYLEIQQTRYCNPPGPYSGTESIYGMLSIGGGGRILDLDAGLISVNSLATGVTADNSTGTVLTLNRDYWLRPSTAPNNKRPYQQIEFLYFQRGAPNSIKIDGQWGYVSTAAGIPARVFRAIVRKVAIAIEPQLQSAMFGGLTSWSQADVKENYAKAVDPAAWQDFFDGAVAAYTRVFVV